MYKTYKQAHDAREAMGLTLMTHCICRVENYKKWRGGWPVASGYVIKPYTVAA